MMQDAHTHSLPVAPEGWARLACLCGTHEAALRDELGERIARVGALAEGFFAPPPKAAPEIELSEQARRITARWQTYPALRSARAGAIFDRIRPELLSRLDRTGRPDEALVHLDAFLRGLPAGVQIFALFQSNPALIDLIVDISATAPALAAYLGQNAGVLDAVLSGRFFAPLPDAEGYREILASAMAPALMPGRGGGAGSGDAGDYEAALAAIRVRWREEQFRIGVHLLRGQLDAAGAGRAYADLAEATVAALWPAVCADFATRHGPLPGRGATVVGMGSLGARWLGRGSDLDLIVIYDPEGQESSTGRRPLPVRSYYARLTQALVTALSAPMAAGRLYQVDMRLRPSGRQGPVATSWTAFRDYQRSEAWTWEHLALTRARPMAGSETLAEDFEIFRRRLIARPGERDRIVADTVDMRARIAQARGAGDGVDPKWGPGGLQDIELLAQTAALLAGATDRDTAGQLAAGAEAGWPGRGPASRLAAAHDVQQRLRTVMRLLVDGPADPRDLGHGAAELLMRELGDDPAGRAAAVRAEAAVEIEAALASWTDGKE